MRSLAKLTRLLPILFILLFACQPEEEQLMKFDPEIQEVEDILASAEVRYLDFSAKVSGDMTQCGESKEYPLMWYLNRSVGKIVIYNTPDYLVVEFSLDPGFMLKKTELGIQIEKDYNDSYYNYVYPVNHDDGIQQFTYKIPLCDFKTVPDKLLFKAEISAWKEAGIKPGKLIKALAKDENLSDKRWRIEYIVQQCDPVIEECQVNCQFGFGMPSVEVAKSFSFSDLGITDWAWGYSHEIKDETWFRLPIKKENLESSPIIGQVTVKIENDIAYIYFQMEEGYPMNTTSVYLSNVQLVSGLPCNYTYNRTYINPDGTWQPTFSDMYVIEKVSDIMANSSDVIDATSVDTQKLYLVTYVDFCE